MVPNLTCERVCKVAMAKHCSASAMFSLTLDISGKDNDQLTRTLTAGLTHSTNVTQQRRDPKTQESTMLQFAIFTTKRLWST